MEPLSQVGPYQVGRINGEVVACHPRLVGPVVISEGAMRGWIERQIRASLTIPALSEPAQAAETGSE